MVTKDSMRIELVPLDQIRQVEADVIRQIAVAREVAEQTITEARSQVKNLLTEAQESGLHSGQVRYKETLSRAEEEAHAIVFQAHNQAKRLRHEGKRRMSKAVCQAVNLVIGLEENGENK
jgi:vacuolar-type H+-ATPase subunit H